MRKTLTGLRQNTNKSPFELTQWKLDVSGIWKSDATTSNYKCKSPPNPNVMGCVRWNQMNGEGRAGGGMGMDLVSMGMRELTRQRSKINNHLPVQEAMKSTKSAQRYFNALRRLDLKVCASSLYLSIWPFS